jgi:hypothetical protein
MGKRIKIRISGIDPDPESVSGMNIPDHISGSLETSFGVKISKIFYVDVDPGIFLTLDPG